MVEALDRQELEEAEVQFQQALLEDSEAQLLDLGQYLESIGFLPSGKKKSMNRLQKPTQKCI